MTFSAYNQLLTKDLSTANAECARLIAENARLASGLQQAKRQNESKDKPPDQSPRTATLLLGSSHVARLERVSQDVQVRGPSGASTKEAQDMLRKHPDNDTHRVTLVVWSNDCDSDKSTEEIISNFKDLINEAQRVALDGVIVVSVLPRLIGEAYQSKADAINNDLETVCGELKCTFVNNDPNLRLQNGAVDDSVFAKDNVHLTTIGYNRLIANLQLEGKVRVRRSYAQVASTLSSTPTTPETKTGGDRHRDSTRHSTHGLQKQPKQHRQQQQQQQTARCWNCSEPGHVTDSCRHGQRITCHRCGKQGHKQKNCRVKR